MSSLGFHLLLQMTLIEPRDFIDYLKTRGVEFINGQHHCQQPVSAEVVVRLLDYCLTGVRNEDMLRTSKLDKILEGLPLLLTEDGRLQKFSAADCAILTRFLELLPHSHHRIVKREVLENTRVLKMLLDHGRVEQVRIAAHPDRFAQHLVGELHAMPSHSLSEVAGPRCVEWLTLGMVAKLAMKPSLHATDADLVKWSQDETLTRWLRALWHFILDQHYGWEDIRNILKNWAVIPITDGTHQALVKVRHAKCILCSQSDATGVADALRKLGVWSLAFSALFPHKADDSAQERTTTKALDDLADLKALQAIVQPGLCDISNCQAVLDTFSLVKKSYSGGELTKDEASDLLTYFARTPNNLGEQGALLCSLPMFPLVQFTDEAAAGPLTTSQFFVLKDDHPLNNQEMVHRLRKDYELTILRDVDGKTREFLCSVLCKKEITICAFYERYMLSLFAKMDTNSQIKHLEYITRLPDKQTLQERIEHLPFVATAAGTLQSPASLFDPKNQQFAMLISQQWTPSEDWQTDAGLALLRTFGLQTELNLEHVLCLAKEISSDPTAGDASNRHLRTVSEPNDQRRLSVCLQNAFVHLVCTLCQRHDLDESTPESKKIHQQLGELASVPFIFDAPVESNTAPQQEIPTKILNMCEHGDHDKPRCMQESALATEWSVVWSKCKVLPAVFSSLPNSTAVYKSLYLCEPPPVQMVLEHFQKMMECVSELQPSCEQDDHGHFSFFMKILESIFAFLNCACDSKKSGEAANKNRADCESFLQGRACMPVESEGVLQLLKPEFVVAELGNKAGKMSFLPYLGCLLPSFAQYAQLRDCLRVDSKPSLRHYSQILRCLQVEMEEAGARCANNQQLDQIKSATKYLLAEVQDEANLYQSQQPLTPLFLPCQIDSQSDATRLRPAHEVLINDAIWLQNRITNFPAINYLQHWNSLPADERLPKFASYLGTRLLSSAVSVKRNDHKTAGNVIWDSARSGPWRDATQLPFNRCAASIVWFLQSDLFSAVIHRLLEHNKRSKNACDDELQKLKKCRCIVVDKLTTKLTFTTLGEGEFGDEEDIPNSEKKHYCHLERLREPSEDTQLLLYLSDLRDRGHDDEVARDFVEEVTAVIHGEFFQSQVADSRLLLKVLWMCQQRPCNIHQWLDEKEISRCHGEQVFTVVDFEQDRVDLGCPIPDGAGFFTTNPSEDLSQAFSKGDYAVLARETDYILVRVKEEKDAQTVQVFIDNEEHELSVDKSLLTKLCFTAGQNLQQAELWLKQACADLDVLDKLYSTSDKSYYSLLCFLAQQVTEKALKAGLHAAEEGPPPDLMNTHNVRGLAKSFVHANSRADREKMIASANTVHDFYVPTRYPTNNSGPDTYRIGHVEKGRDACKFVVAAVKEFVEQAAAEKDVG